MDKPGPKNFEKVAKWGKRRLRGKWHGSFTLLLSTGSSDCAKGVEWVIEGK